MPQPTPTPKREACDDASTGTVRHPILALWLALLCVCVIAFNLPRNHRATEFEPTPTHHKIRINSAPTAELQLLPGVGGGIAQGIVSHREKHGPFTDAAQLENVRYIGVKTRRKMTPWVRFD